MRIQYAFRAFEGRGFQRRPRRAESELDDVARGDPTPLSVIGTDRDALWIVAVDEDRDLMRFERRRRRGDRDQQKQRNERPARRNQRQWAFFSAFIARSSPSSVSGNMRSDINSFTMPMDGI